MHTQEGQIVSKLVNTRLQKDQRRKGLSPFVTFVQNSYRFSDEI